MKKTKLSYITQLSFLVAITIVLAATPVGYITLGPLSFTIMVLPVAIGGLMLGMPAGLLLGLVFGVTSFIKAPSESLGILLLGYSMPLSLIICIVPRVAVGAVSAFLGKLIKASSFKSKYVLYLAAGFVASAANTVLFTSFIDIFCGELIQNEFGATIWSLVLFGGIVEAFANAFLTASIATPLIAILNKGNLSARR